MKSKLTDLSQRYVMALRKQLEQSSRASLRPVLRLGRQPVALGLQSLELARIHEQALVTLKLSGSRNGLLKRAELFFTDALTPIAETHRAARQSMTDLKRLNEVPGRRPLRPAVAEFPGSAEGFAAIGAPGAGRAGEATPEDRLRTSE